MEIAKAEESLQAAALREAQGLYTSSASRAYYATFQATQVALEAAGFARPEWSHVGLQAAFANKLTRRRKLYPSSFASDLASLTDLRHSADYRNINLGKRHATRALNKARAFVKVIKGSILHG
jgi:uncharacterized protein (UPF0332 family)